MSLVVNGSIGQGGFSLSVDLRVEPGETLGLVGRNGSGKSTLLHTVAGLRAMRSGTVVIDGTVWDSHTDRRFVQPEDRQCAVVFQDIRLFPRMTCLDNVAFGPRLHGVTDRGRLSEIVGRSLVGG